MSMSRISPVDQGASPTTGQENLPFEDAAVDDDQQSSHTDYSSSFEKHFMKTRIFRRECKCFIERKYQTIQNPESESDDQSSCYCGYMKKDHPKIAFRNVPSETMWDAAEHTRLLPTNAYGEIDFVGFGVKIAKYARVDVHTKSDTIMEMLTNAWGAEKPNLLISVTGGARSLNMKPRLREVFQRGLMKAALGTGAWIVTGGFRGGVMKMVGEAVRDYGVTAQGRVTAIGIAPWGCVKNRECLIDPEGKWPASYPIEKFGSRGQLFLDPNHSYFILGDNGTQQNFGVEIPFRAKLEETIGVQKLGTGGGAVPVPMCLLVVNGGPGTLETVHSAVKSRTPTIIIKGSGRAADILAYAYQNAREHKVIAGDDTREDELKTAHHELDQHLIAEITLMLKETFGNTHLSRQVELIKESVFEMNLISVFELDSENSAIDVDVAIMKALLKANKDQVMNQLRLALAWNRIDVTKSEIFTPEQNWATGELDDVMLSAIMLNRVDFVELFLDHGLSLEYFLTVKRLLQLYNDIPNNCLLYKVLSRARQNHSNSFTLEDVGHLIEMLLGGFCQPDYLKNSKLNQVTLESLSKEKSTILEPFVESRTELFSRPAQEPFIWAILMNRHRLSKLFWKEAKESVAAALFARAIFIALKKYTLDTQLLSKLQANADDYEQLAIGVINTCYSSDEKRAHDILIRNMPQWGSTTCILLAYHSDSKRFISQTACQSLLSSIWLGKMKYESRYLKIFVCSIFFPLIPCLIKFEKSETHANQITPAEENKEVPREGKRRVTVQSSRMHIHEKPEKTEKVMQKDKISGLSVFTTFYKAPITKFTTNVLFYFIFLCLYSYILVVELSKDFHVLEGVLIFWVFTIFTEEIRQFSMMYAFSFKSKLKFYFNDMWNLLDIAAICLFTCGMILRFSNTTETLAAARILLSLNLITFFLRVLHIFSINPKLGPILVMISDMLQDLMWFVIILLVFVFSYAIASEAVLYPNSELNWKIFYHLPRKAYWHIYGELFLEDIEGQNTCTNDPALYNDYTELRCPSDTGRYFVPVLLGVYILLTNVLLLNLLIAMFSYTFQKIQERSDMHWCFQRFSLVHEYTQRPFLPPPFIIISHIALLFQGCRQTCLKKKKMERKFCKIFTDALKEQQLLQWENMIANNHLNLTERSITLTSERLELIMSKVEGSHDGQGTVGVEKRLENVEKQLISTTKALEWIVSAMEDNHMGTKRPKPSLSNSETEKHEKA